MMQTLFGKKTVASVMTVFNNAIEDLKLVEDEHVKEAKTKREEAAQALAAAESAEFEAQEAVRVRSNLIAIVSSSLPLQVAAEGV